MLADSAASNGECARGDSKIPFVRIVYHDVYTLKVVCISGMLNPELSYHIALLTALRIIKPAL
jgi:hypothetical protein